MVKYAFIDLETTGIDPDKCGILQLAAILDVDGEVSDRFSIDIRPPEGCLVEEEAMRLNGMTMEKVAGFTPSPEAFLEALSRLDRFIDRFDRDDKCFFVGYNCTRFDVPFVRNWFLSNGNNFYGSYFYSNPIDVMAIASEYLKHVRGRMQNFKLETVARTILKQDFDPEGDLHSAMTDVTLARDVYWSMIGRQ